MSSVGSNVTSDIIADILAENEACLVTFYASGELEATSRYEFKEVHRCFRVQESSEKAGSGIFLKYPAAPGDLLIVEKEVASCLAYPSEQEDLLVRASKEDRPPLRPRIPPRVQEGLTNKFIDLLSDGAGLESITNPASRVANDRMRKSLPWRDLKSEASSSHGRKPDVLFLLLKDTAGDIVAKDAICSTMTCLTEDEPRQIETLECWGLWFLVSRIKHSCAPNCHRVRVGQAMFIRAAKAIAAGEELTVPYFDIFEPLAVRDEHCQTFGFRCECCRCTFERSLGTPYNEIQMQIIQLRVQLQTERKTGCTVTRNYRRLLNALADLAISVTAYVRSEQLDLLQPRPHTESTEPASKRQKEGHMSKKDMLRKGWIEASFIHGFIAMFLLFDVRPFIGGFDPFQYIRSLNQDVPIITTRSAVPLILHRTLCSAVKLLGIIEKVHPGDLLGQKLYSMTVLSCAQLLHSDNSGIDLAVERECLERFRSMHVSSFSLYYGSLVEPLVPGYESCITGRCFHSRTNGFEPIL